MASFDSFHEFLEKSYDDATFSDAIVRCGGKEFKVHKLVLAAHSKFFSKAFTGDWKEAARGGIDLEEVDVDVVEAMLHFMYHFDYCNNYGASTMVFHAQVYGIADKYLIPALMEHAKEKFRTAIGTGWAMDDFPLAIAEAYSTPSGADRGLRDLVVDVSRMNRDELLKKSQFRDAFRETPDFAVDMVVSTPSSLATYKCPICGKLMHANLAERASYHCMHCGSKRSDWSSFISRVKQG